MAQQNLIHPEDAVIERDEKREVVMLFDSDGNTYREFPIEWTDEQVKQALLFANYAYAQGWDAGASDKAREIRNALGVGNELHTLKHTLTEEIEKAYDLCMKKR